MDLLKSILLDQQETLTVKRVCRLLSLKPQEASLKLAQLYEQVPSAKAVYVAVHYGDTLSVDVNREKRGDVYALSMGEPKLFLTNYLIDKEDTFDKMCASRPVVSSVHANEQELEHVLEKTTKQDVSAEPQPKKAKVEKAVKQNSIASFFKKQPRPQ